MNADRSAELVAGLLQQAKDAVDTAKTANRNRKSLAGDNHYGNKFHDQCTTLTGSGTKLFKLLKSVDGDSIDVDSLRESVASVKMRTLVFGISWSGRASGLRDLFQRSRAAAALN
jgi:hypothetical protein